MKRPTLAASIEAQSQTLLLAFLDAPSGKGVETALAQLAGITPRPTAAQAARIASRIPGVWQSRLLSRYSALLASARPREVQMDLAAQMRKDHGHGAEMASNRDDEAEAKIDLTYLDGPWSRIEAEQKLREIFGLPFKPTLGKMEGLESQ